MQGSSVSSYPAKLFPGSSHSWALQELTSLPNDTKILDLGVGSGVIGRELQARGFFNLYGVEPNESSSEEANSTYKKIYRSIDEVPDEKFDVVLFLDIIEHTAEPERFVHSALSRFSPKITLLSIPNITHWYIRASILAGRFEYADRGILDKTHLQFFSIRRIQTLIFLLKEYGFKDIARSASVVPIEFILPSALSSLLSAVGFTKIRQMIAFLWPSLFGYQYLIRARC